MNMSWDNAAQVLKKGGVIILPTDTLYGIVGKSSLKKTVEQIYKIRQRDKGKPCIVLISSFNDLDKFSAPALKKNDPKNLFLHHVWPGKVSVVLPCSDPKFRYLHRGTNAIAFRMIGPKNKDLFNLLKQTGPLIAPSANLEGFAPATTISEAKKYFSDKVNGYISGGKLDSSASTLVSLLRSKPKVLRQGSVDIYKP